MKRITTALVSIFLFSNSYAINIPALYPNIVEKEGHLIFVDKDKTYPLKPVNTTYTLDQLVGNPIGIEKGIQFNFGDLSAGKLYYGFIKQGYGDYAQPIFFGKASDIISGQATINIADNLAKPFNITDWEKTEAGLMGYRVVDAAGRILYDGKVAFTGKGPFQVNAASITEGPFVHLTEEGHFYHSARLSFDTLKKTTAIVEISNGLRFQADNASVHHEIVLTNLTPGTVYDYTVETHHDNDIYQKQYSFKTAPLPGEREPFVFAYISDSRRSQGGGERDLGGVDAYIIKKMMTLVRSKNAAFVQFTGDMITGFGNNIEQTEIEYRNWKRVVEPVAHYLPIMTTMGNHEALMHIFLMDDCAQEDMTDSCKEIKIDRFPFETDSAEAVFARQFVNPTNGPTSEDGASYDPNPNQPDFPTYKENVFYYTYDNIAMIVLNSNYWYAPSIDHYPQSGGNLHGYLMDNQLTWLETTINQLEWDNHIDFIFVTVHTPAFPNSAHIKDDMWYNGDNTKRAVVKYEAEGNNQITKGIIEQRDHFLKILMKSHKVLGFLVGDEHNFNWMLFDETVNIYPKGWDKEDIRQRSDFRPLYQIINGAASAPYYAFQETTPWSEHVRNFTTQYAVVFFYIHGKSIEMEVINPDTLEVIMRTK